MKLPKMKNRRLSFILSVAAGFFLFLCINLETAAASEGGILESQNKTKNQRQSLIIKAEFQTEYDSNVFRLSSNQKDRLRINDLEDRASRRFIRMNSIGDVFFTPRLSLKYRRQGLWKKQFQIVHQLAYSVFTQNPLKNFFTANLDFKQNVSKNSSIKLENQLRHGVFRANHLASASDDDFSGDIGNIDRDERIYAAGIFYETESIISYKHVTKGEKCGFSVCVLPIVDFEPFIGLSFRRYRQPFRNRNRDVVLGGTKFLLDFGRLDLSLGFRFEDSSSPNNEELVLVDETSNGVASDFNLDGRFKPNAPLITNVDYSRKNVHYNLGVSYRLFRSGKLAFLYRQRKTHFSSSNPLDIEHFSQEEIRHRLRSQFDWNFYKRWQSRVRYEHVFDTEYESNLIVLAISYQFKRSKW
jgi:hypothetical protein